MNRLSSKLCNAFRLRRLHHASLLALVSSTFAPLVGCSLVLNASPDQCNTDGDCRAKGAASAVCSNHLCVVTVPNTEAPSITEACTRAKCVEKTGDPMSVCRPSDNTCVSLLSEDCNAVMGKYQNDNALIVGALFDTEGGGATVGVALRNAIDLAINDFLPYELPTKASARPLAVVSCNQSKDILRATKYLTETIRVPVIIGPSTATQVMSIAKDITVPAKVALVSPTASGPELVDFDRSGLIWTTATPVASIAAATVRLLSELEKRVRLERKLLPEAKIKVALAARGVVGLLEPVQSAAIINGRPANSEDNAPYFKGLPAYDIDYDPSISQIVGFEPDIVMLLGGPETTQNFLVGIEKALSATASRPYYILSSGARNGALFSALAKPEVAQDPTLRTRVFGTVPGRLDTPGFMAFRAAYEAKYSTYPETALGLPNAYDAVYLIAYAAVMTFAKEQPLDGQSLASNLNRLAQGEQIPVGPGNVSNAFKTLSIADAQIDLIGASGPLDFELYRGEAQNDISVWCIGSDAQGQPQFRYPGYYDHANQTLMGAPTKCP